jgi:hypothetical protein
MSYLLASMCSFGMIMFVVLVVFLGIARLISSATWWRG